MEKELAYQIAHAELTKGQVRLAGYILNNQKRVLGMTALEVGREVGMSDASLATAALPISRCSCKRSSPCTAKRSASIPCMTGS